MLEARNVCSACVAIYYLTLVVVDDVAVRLADDFVDVVHIVDIFPHGGLSESH